ncbi:MAG TPA: DUF1572 family protein [Blastocatellia bacterium]|nr:DUF1572 family protein [Blastocatellia bacterium]
MQGHEELAKAALDAFRGRITGVFPAQIKSCIAQLDEDQLWWRPNDESNSVGNLVLHLSGSIRHNLARAIGGFRYERDRPAEFAERGPVPKERLVEIFDETIRLALATLDGFDSSRMLDPSEDLSHGPTLFHSILTATIHLATHAGQIVYITKMLKAGSLDELWIRTHREAR